MSISIRPVVLPVCLVCLVALVASGCGGPFVLLPGGMLSGETVPVPSEWGFAEDFGTAQLETRPDDPYSVNIAYTVIAGRLYINAGDTETQWVKNIAADPLVRLRIDGVIYLLRCERVTDQAEIAAFGKVWTSRLMFSRDPAELDEVWIYRLVSP